MSRVLLIVLLLLCTRVLADERMPAYLLQLPDSVTDVFVADTGSARFHRYARTAQGLELVESTYMSVGENGVGKEREWDRKTPLGIYFVADRLDTSRMHEKYGVIAFPLDYPNIRDRQEGRSGNGIWLHGVQPGGQRRPAFDTDGCVALPNEDLSRLKDRITPMVTPVVVARNIRWSTEDDRARITRELKDSVSEWAHALAADDPAAYLALYSPDFSYRGLPRDEWQAFRTTSFRERGVAQVSIGDLLLLAEPEEPGVYLSRFRQRIQVGTQSTTSVKRLYWRRGGDGHLRIIAEDNG
jgi:murein L,D-transpeptidase YafK